MRITPKNLIAYQENKKKLVILISSMILLIGAIFCGLNLLFPFFLFFSENILNTGLTEPILQIIFSLLYIANFLVYYLIIEMICRVFYKTKENSLNLLISFGINFFPMVLYLLIHFIFFSIDLSYFQMIDNVLLNNQPQD